MSLQTGATVEPLANCIYAVQQSGFKIGDNAAVYGAGTIGLFTIQVLKVSGANKIYVLEPVESKHKIAKELGATKSFSPRKWKKIFRLTDKIGPDHIFDCVGVPDTFMSSMQLVKKGGHITLIGIHVEPFEMKGFMQLMLKNITMRGTFSFNQDVFRTALKFLANGKITSTPLISKTIGLNDVPNTFKNLSKPDHKEIKVLVEFP
jgi:(R,R)-butanediol dehydrogenase/meso-butanediol dehydrogenase/diacetyl reductase